ncbi:hypothetical protein C5B42_04295 [Candidatus Cerribacteria bacterium 'Amazon FNV 2010 28 9']|uniref:Uncharacterized protein n=1 Tax=Candidatus Cerribacteria bacterium 'Amazon FNV 2010 28 9' TaxID=2081795 RepID=A0A317JPL5_9BACT|nr:MAG: hypothetical protein C5B42_04295 [Candidatus Cerribacteria bacterium 'Amazon FNV 2010 28 9']
MAQNSAKITVPSKVTCLEMIEDAKSKGLTVISSTEEQRGRWTVIVEGDLATRINWCDKWSVYRPVTRRYGW